MRAFIVIGAAVAIFWVVAFYIIANRMAHTGEGAACRNEQILLAVSRNQGIIHGITQVDNDFVVTVGRHWAKLQRRPRIDIGMAAWCVIAHEGKGGMVRITSGDTEVGRVENGKWTSRFGE